MQNQQGWNPPPGQGQGQGQYGAPPQGQYGAPPQGQYGAPPQGQYGAPPQGQYGAPPQGQYGAPPQGQHGAPPQHGASPQGQYGAPPQGQYGAPPQGQYGAPPPGQHGGPPQGQYGAPPQGQYGAPPQGQQGGPPQGQYGGPPPQGQYQQQGQYYQGPPQGQQQHQQGQYYQGPPQGQQYQGPPQGQQPQGAPQGQYQGWPPGGTQGNWPPQEQPYNQGPPQGQYGAPPPHQQQQQHTPPTPLSPGYDLKKAPPRVDTSSQVEGFRKAMKGMGTDEKKLIQVATSIRDPYLVNVIRAEYNKRFMKDLMHDLKDETGGEFEETLLAIMRGPLQQDVYLLEKSLTGAGTDEDSVNDVLLSRSNADLKVIKEEYQRQYKRSLEADVRDDTSDKVQRMYTMALKAARAEDSAPVMPQQVDQDVTELQRATEGTNFGANQIAVAEIFTSRSDGQLRAIHQAYAKKYHRALDDVIKKEFSGDMEDALMWILNRAVDPAMADAKALEKTMSGLGTRDTLLINRVVRMHWNKERMQQAKKAYKAAYHRDLIGHVKEETNGDYEKLLVALLESA